MEVYQAEVFLAVATRLHFGQAAVDLNISQSQLSKAMRRLETQLGAALFTRSTRRVEMTAAGQALVDPARKLLVASKAAVEAVATGLSAEAKRLSLSFAGPSLGPLVGELVRKHTGGSPDTELDVHPGVLSHIGLQRVLGGELDLALGRWERLPKQVHAQVLARETLVAAVPSTSEWAKRQMITPADLAEAPWVTLPPTTDSALYVATRGWIGTPDETGNAMRVAHRAPDSWTLLSLVGAGEGVGITLDSIRDAVKVPGVTFLPLNPQPVALEATLIWREDNTAPTLQRFLKDTLPALTLPAKPAPAS